PPWESAADGTMSRHTRRGASMSDRPIRMGFVGAGRNTRSRHIPGLQKQPGVEFVAVANRSRESGERVAKEFGIRRVEADWRDVVALSGHNILNMGIWYEAMARWLGPAKRVSAMGKVAVPRRRDESGAMHEVKVPDHVDVLATLAGDAVAHLRFSAVTALGPANEVWIFGSDGTLRLEADAKRLSGARRGDKELREIPIPAERRVGWRVEEEFVNAVRGREKVSHTTFEDGVRYMEFTDA